MVKIHIRGNYISRTVWLNGVKLAIGKSRKLLKSSNEFNWGYSGSGPTQLSFAICLELYGKDFDYIDFREKYIATLPKSDFNKRIYVPGDETLQKILDLEKKRREARNNANIQRRKTLAGHEVRVRPEFWEQVGMDYTREINELKTKTNESGTNQ